MLVGGVAFVFLLVSVVEAGFGHVFSEAAFLEEVFFLAADLLI